jgi:hypothetical protein
MSTDLSGSIVISLERLRKLEALEAKRKARALTEEGKRQLEKVHERDKLNPEAHRLRVKKWREANRDMLNAKRREQYKQKKAAAAAASHETSGAASDVTNALLVTPELSDALKEAV